MQTLGCILVCYSLVMYIDILGDSTLEETPLFIFSHSCKTHKRHLSLSLGLSFLIPVQPIFKWQMVLQGSQSLRLFIFYLEQRIARSHCHVQTQHWEVSQFV
ncbi:unnamed protein product [Musa textilis]